MNRDNIRNIVFWCILLKLFSELYSFQGKWCSRYIELKEQIFFSNMSDWLWRYFPRMSFWGRGRPSPALLDAEQRCYNIQPSQADFKRNICRCGLARSNAAPEMLAAAGLLDHQQVFFLLKSKRTIPVFANEISRLPIWRGGGGFFMGSNQEQTRKVTS